MHSAVANGRRPSRSVLGDAEGGLQDLSLVGELRGQRGERVMRLGVRTRASNVIAADRNISKVGGNTKLRRHVGPPRRAWLCFCGSASATNRASSILIYHFGGSIRALQAEPEVERYSASTVTTCPQSGHR